MVEDGSCEALAAWLPDVLLQWFIWHPRTDEAARRAFERESDRRWAHQHLIDM